MSASAMSKNMDQNHSSVKNNLESVKSPEEKVLFIDENMSEEERNMPRDRNKVINGGYSAIGQPKELNATRGCPEFLTEDTTCGFWIFRGPVLQRFANKKAYVFLYGLVGCIISATYAYFNGTITTIEKRYKIPSRNTGIISVGNDISTLFLSAIVSYYGGRGHRPRWIAFGLFTVVLFCLLTALPHFIYGPGENALTLTTEYGAQFDDDERMQIMEEQKRKILCQARGANETSPGLECDREEGNLMPQILFFLAQLVGGVGGSLYYTLGVSYIDDNVKKSKTPALISLSYFLRMLGPAIGYSLASVFLKFYISPSLHPTITNSDPRWLGAWWLGWIVLGCILFVFAVLLGMFPKVLPRAAARNQIRIEKLTPEEIEAAEAEEEPSVRDLLKTFRRLICNRTLMCNTFASVFYFFGYIPYWIFTPKYLEIQYKVSSSTSSLVTGTVALAFSAIGVLLSGICISKYKPRARYMASWNVFVGAMSVIGMIGYIFLGCPDSDKSLDIVNLGRFNGDIGSQSLSLSCSSKCYCDYVKYSPVCGQLDGKTYISACHAGCTDQVDDVTSGGKIFTGCSCIQNSSSNSLMNISEGGGGIAVPGPCTVNCFYQFYLFLAVMCFIKFTGATGRATNFLVSVRCVNEKDKPVSMGLAAMIISLCSFIPAPIFFGAVLDKSCILWGKTCTGKGNCWLYDSESLRYKVNLYASLFVAVGTVLDLGVWYFVKDLQIFDEKVKENELAEVEKEEELLAEKQ